MVFSKVRRANRPLKNQLAAFLSLLSAYVPGSYLLESQCLEFLKHDDSIHGHLSLEDRMQPFSHLIITYQQDETSERRVRMAHPMIAQCCTELMAEADKAASRIIPTELSHFLLENEDATEDLINNMMSKDKIFRDLRVQENLLKFHGVVKKYSLFTTIGGMEIKVKAHKRDSLWFPHEVSFYLGFTIRGLLAFGIKRKPSENRPPKCCASCGSDMAESKTDVKQDSCTWTAATPKRTTLNHAPTYRRQTGTSRSHWETKRRTYGPVQFQEMNIKTKTEETGMISR
ncbi:sterile alpha motif domain-containing protein 9-like protein [Lates japonicus]|uniref:Sterile alpha motif domain-containing protein 9-like protein n=1 Tax=Lates japonicus TaxID=270547 RepID=A0AAD3N0T0_LATJO|nr:sterile alpha motif domain-containing protein 9-like protein [Lates japonicus]